MSVMYTICIKMIFSPKECMCGFLDIYKNDFSLPKRFSMYDQMFLVNTEFIRCRFFHKDLIS